MRVEAIERLGFGYDAVAAINPKIVYCAATGFDQDGPDADKPAFDDIIQAASGLVAITGIGQRQPDFIPTLVADKTTGMAAGQRGAGGAVPSRAHRRGPICRSADAGDDDRVRARRASRRPHLRSVAGAAGLCPHSRRRAQAVRRPRTAISASCPTRPIAGSRSSKAVGRSDLARAAADHGPRDAQCEQSRSSTQLLADHHRARAPRRNGCACCTSSIFRRRRSTASTICPSIRSSSAIGLFQTHGASDRRHGALCPAADQIRGLAGERAPPGAAAGPAQSRAAARSRFCARAKSRAAGRETSRNDLSNTARRHETMEFRTRRRRPHAQGARASLRRGRADAARSRRAGARGSRARARARRRRARPHRRGLDARSACGGSMRPRMSAASDLPAVSLVGVNEEMGRTITPYTLPPDSPNLRMLMATVNERQREAYLAPYVRGETISAIGISEPGAGSDPAGDDHARRARRRRLGAERPQDLDQPRRRRRLHHRHGGAPTRRSARAAASRRFWSTRARRASMCCAGFR